MVENKWTEIQRNIIQRKTAPGDFTEVAYRDVREVPGPGPRRRRVKPLLQRPLSETPEQETFTQSEFQGAIESDIHKAEILKRSIDPNQYYSIPGRPGYYRGDQIIREYVDPVLERYQGAYADVGMQRQEFRDSPYVKYRRTDQGFEMYEDPTWKQSYEQARWESLPLGTKVARTTIGGLLFGPKLVTDYFLSGGRYDIKGEGVKRSFEEGKRWESENWRLLQEGKDIEVLKRYYTSPLAIAAYTYGAFSIGSNAIRSIIPKARQVLGKLVYGRNADIRIAKQIYNKSLMPGQPTYISPGQRSWINLYGKYPVGRTPNPFAAKLGSTWKGYGTSWSFYNASLMDEIARPKMFPYEHIKMRPKFIETSRSYVAMGDDVSYISKGYWKSYYRPKSDIMTGPVSDVFPGKPSRYYFDRYIRAYESPGGSPFKYTAKQVSSPKGTQWELSGARQLLLQQGSKKSISQYEWYQPPIPKISYRAGSIGSRSMDTFSMAYGRMSMKWLDFLEAGIVSSDRWMDKISDRISAIKPISIPMSSSLNISRVDVSQDLLKESAYDKLLDRASLSASAVLSKSESAMRQLTKQTLSLQYPQALSPGYDATGASVIPGSRPVTKGSFFKFFPLSFEGEGQKVPSVEPSGKGYGVQIKERYIYKGKKRKPERFKTVGTHPLSLSDSHRLGSFLTDESTARSYRVVRRKGKPKPLKYDITDRSSKFNRNKKGIMVEGNLFTIDSPGELKGITWQGIMSNMKKAGSRKKVVVKSKSMKNITKDINKLFDVRLKRLT